MHGRLRDPNNLLILHNLVDDIAEPRPDMNIKVTAFTESKHLYYTVVRFQSGDACAVTSAAVEQPGPKIICFVGFLYNISKSLLTAGPAAHWKYTKNIEKTNSADSK